MQRGLAFDFEVPVTFFEKASAAPGKQRRIGGIVSTESPDRMGEVVLQRGLDFNDFLSNGWFNDNHSKETTDIVGFPEGVQLFQKGQKLPNGEVAPATGHWVEGYLLDTQKAGKIWELGKALQQTKRRLGFSVEGSIKRRLGPLRKTIAKAQVRNVAITNCPVNDQSKMDILSKSLQAIQNAEPDWMEKALGMGTTAPGFVAGQAPVGPKTGGEAGQVLAQESLEQEGQKRIIFAGQPEPDEEDEAKKSLTDAEAFVQIQKRYPHASAAQVGRLLDLTKALKRQGRL